MAGQSRCQQCRRKSRCSCSSQRQGSDFIAVNLLSTAVCSSTWKTTDGKIQRSFSGNMNEGGEPTELSGSGTQVPPGRAVRQLEIKPLMEADSNTEASAAGQACDSGPKLTFVSQWERPRHEASPLPLLTSCSTKTPEALMGPPAPPHHCWYTFELGVNSFHCSPHCSPWKITCALNSGLTVHLFLSHSLPVHMFQQDGLIYEYRYSRKGSSFSISFSWVRIRTKREGLQSILIIFCKTEDSVVQYWA